MIVKNGLVQLMCVLWNTFSADLCCYRKLRKEQFIREKNDKLEYEP